MKQWIKSLFKAARMTSSDDSGNYRRGYYTYQGQEGGKGYIFTPYGFIHNPPDNSLALILSQNGQDSNSITMVDKPKTRKKNLSKGASGIENQTVGSYIVLENPDIEMHSPNDITITATDINITISGSITFTTGGASVTLDSSGITVTSGDVVADGISLKTHVHGGVTSGGSNTGVPV